MGNRHRSKYISVEASESESEYTSEDVEDFSSIVEPQRNWAKLTEDLERRYAQIPDEEEEEEPETIEASLQQQNLVPRGSSPRLFLVRVTRGAEREILLKIVSKKSNIISVVYKEGLRGYLYIESFQKKHIIEGIEGIRGINKNRLSVVPQNEMIEAITYKERRSHNGWGRIRKGKYKNDLVQVLDITAETVTIKVIPRLNEVRRLFNPNEFKNEVMEKGPGEYIYKRDLFVDGFLVKEILLNSVDLDIEPTIQEMEEFQVKKTVSLKDKVKIVKGELIGLVGTVESVKSNSVCIETEMGRIDVVIDDVIKCFDVGDQVSYRGENGVILKIEGRNCILGIRNFTEDLKAEIEELKPPILEGPPKITTNTAAFRSRRDPLINKEITIQKGPYKGYKGVVKDIYSNVCRVQLDSNMKFIHISPDTFIVSEKRGVPISDGYSSYNRTPRYMDMPEGTPGYRNTPGYKTPSYGMGDRTPGYKTPSYGMGDRTPGYKTPSYGMGDRTPGYKTPSYGMGDRTPGYKTPSYGMGDRTPGYKTPTYKAGHKGSSARDNEEKSVTYKPYQAVPNKEETGTDWLIESKNIFKGCLITVGGKELKVEDLKNNLYITEEGAFDQYNVQLVKPKENDGVCIVNGEHKGTSGVLLAVNGDFGVIKTNEGPVKRIQIDQMTKKL